MLTDRADLGLGGVQLLARLWAVPGFIGDAVEPYRIPLLGDVPPHWSLYTLWTMQKGGESVEQHADSPDIPPS